MTYNKADRLQLLMMVLMPVWMACRGKDITNHLRPVVIQTDFGVKDGAVSAMKGVAYSVNPGLSLFDLTHEIPAYNIWEAAYRLSQTVPYWPAETVFVSVVDPGVGTSRQSVVARLKSGQYIVTPDNGTLTLLADEIGIESLRQIDEAHNRRAGSATSYTFHGRDVYAYTAAKLASGKISFEEVGRALQREVMKLSYQRAVLADGVIRGSIPVLYIQYGNVWSNIPDSLLQKVVCRDQIPLVNTFGQVAEGKPLGYLNSLMNFSVAINMGSFANEKKIGSGPGWTIEISR